MFLDEVNTSSCLGLFKEIIIDKTFDGKVDFSFAFVLYCWYNESQTLLRHVSPGYTLGDLVLRYKVIF